MIGRPELATANQPQMGGLGGGASIPGANPSAGGTGQPSNNDVAHRLSKIMSTDNPLMRRASATGMQSANRRGLANSSLSAGASQNAMIAAAAPIASQDSQQGHQKDLNNSNLAAAERERQLAAFTSMQGNYTSALTNTLNNHEIPASARDAVQRSLLDQNTAGLRFMQDLYGSDLGYGQEPAQPTQPAPPPYYNYGGLGGLNIGY